MQIIRVTLSSWLCVGTRRQARFKNNQYSLSYPIRAVLLLSALSVTACGTNDEIETCLPIKKQQGVCFIEGTFVEDEIGFRKIETEFPNIVTVADVFEFEKRFPDLQSGNRIHIVSDFEVYNGDMISLRGIRELRHLTAERPTE